jgi:hypothetical protein
MPGLLFFPPQRLAILISEASARTGPVSTAATSGPSGIAGTNDNSLPKRRGRHVADAIAAS